MPQCHEGDAEIRLRHGLLVEAFGVCHGQREGVEALI